MGSADSGLPSGTVPRDQADSAVRTEPRGPARPTAPTDPYPVHHAGSERDAALRGRLAASVRALDAPDVVLGCSRDGRHAVCSGGTSPEPAVPRDHLRYELGAATMPFTALLLAELVRAGRVGWHDPAIGLLAPGARAGRRPVTLLHLATHTSGLPALPAGFRAQALPRRGTNPYADYPAELVRDAFLRLQIRWARLHLPRPGTRWRFSPFGVAVLGQALAAAGGTRFEDLLHERVLAPLGMDGATLAPPPGAERDGPAPDRVAPPEDATGHRRDGRTPVPPLDTGGFAAAGALRATPHELLSGLDALARPGRAAVPGTLPVSLAEALRTVRRPVLRRGRQRELTQTVAWFRQDGDRGPMYFHSGATWGQQAFLGFRPATGTAIVALATRRSRARDSFHAVARELLDDLD